MELPGLTSRPTEVSAQAKAGLSGRREISGQPQLSPRRATGFDMADYNSNSILAVLGPKINTKEKVATQGGGVMNSRFTLFLVVVSSLCVLTVACSNRTEPVKSTPSGITGFWKARCSDAFGVQIKKTGNLFSVSFCGPGGCFEPGTWMPNTPILGDPKYQLINPITLEIQHGDGWQTFRKCTTNTNPVLDYSTMPAGSPSPTQQGSAQIFQPNLGLPDYIHKSPFKTNGSVVDILKKQLALVVTSKKPCKVGEVDTADLGKTPLFTNICDKAQSDALRKLIPELAPDLTFSTTTVWKASANSSGEGDVLVTHIDISTEENFHYPYLSLWRIGFKDGQVDVQFGGSFLAGEIHAIRTFGHEDKTKKVFVKHLSCIECEPWVYLTIVDFSRKTATPVKFTYAEDHKEYDDTIEYELPAMGHSVDAKAETRIPKTDAGQLADLIQTFRYTEETKTEWWVFSCKNERCDYRMFNGSLPEKYRSSWASADKL